MSETKQRLIESITERLKQLQHDLSLLQDIQQPGTNARGWLDNTIEYVDSGVFDWDKYLFAVKELDHKRNK